MSKFVDEIEWSGERYNLENFLKSFPLPQVVKVRKLPSSASRGKRSKISFFDEIVVLHSVRELKIIRASDSFKREFFLPKGTGAKVEVIWKKYKKVYDNVKKLSEDFPAHVLVTEGDSMLGIQKGDVLKLKQTITSRDNKYLQCALVNRVWTEINIPFGYKGLFKTLGDLKQEHIILSDAIHHCKLPRVVKFIDHKLKMKKVDCLPSQPLLLQNQGEVTLHEVINYADIIACKTMMENVNRPGICVMTIPLDNDVEVCAATATSRSDPRYSQLCASIKRTVSVDMISKLAIQHSSWIVYEVEDNKHQNGSRPSSVLSISSSKNLPKICIKSVSQTVGAQDSKDREAGEAGEKQPPLPPRMPIPPSQQKGYRSLTLQSRRGSGQGSSHLVARKTKSLTFEYDPWESFPSSLPRGSPQALWDTKPVSVNRPVPPIASSTMAVPRRETVVTSPLDGGNPNSSSLEHSISPSTTRQSEVPGRVSSPFTNFTSPVLSRQMALAPCRETAPASRPAERNSSPWSLDHPRSPSPSKQVVVPPWPQDLPNSSSASPLRQEALPLGWDSLSHPSSVSLKQVSSSSTETVRTYEIVNTNSSNDQEEEQRPAFAKSQNQAKYDKSNFQVEIYKNLLKLKQFEISEDSDGYVTMNGGFSANSSLKET